MFEVIINSVTENVLEIVLTIISAIVSCYVIPYIKNDLVPLLKEKRVYSIVKKFVQAAEKLAESGVIEKRDKKKYVIDLLNEKGITINDVLDAFIESAIKELDTVISATKNEILKYENVEKIEP